MTYRLKLLLQFWKNCTQTSWTTDMGFPLQADGGLGFYNVVWGVSPYHLRILDELRKQRIDWR